MSTHIHLRQQIYQAIETGISAEEIDALFLDLFEFQLRKNIPYNTYCNRLNIKTDTVSDWTKIPPVVTDAFKLHDSPLKSFKGDADATFHTSGTTRSLSGHHSMQSLDVYRASVIHGWKHLGAPVFSQAFFLSKPVTHFPHSSLLRMFHFLQEDWGLAPSSWIGHDAGFDLEQIRAAKSPIGLLGTALSFIQLFEQLGKDSIDLPDGSWAMETGGYKASGVDLSKEDLYASFNAKLGLAEDQIWNEYSMTELSSQFYTRGIGNPHIGPPWLRFRIIHPETLEEVDEDEMGYLVLYDLANIDSVCAIQTQDFAVKKGDGFLLVGRDPGALPRGCSRMLDYTNQKK